MIYKSRLTEHYFLPKISIIMAKFEHISEPPSGSALEKPEKEFLYEEQITAKDIERMAFDIAEELRGKFKGASEEEKKVILIHALNDDAIMYKCANSFFPEGMREITAEVRENIKLFDIAQNTLARIRDDIIDRLQSWSMRPDYEFLEDVHFSSKEYAIGLVKLEGDKLFKMQQQEYPLREAEQVRARKEAMQVLIELQKDPNQTDPARHFIAQVHEADIENNDEVIMNSLDVVTINKFLDENQEDPKKAKQGLEAILDCLKGSKYLSDNDLIIGDLHLDNLSMDNNTGRGKIVDLKCLYKKGVFLEKRRIRDDVRPPSTYGATEKNEVLFQFGMALNLFL